MEFYLGTKGLEIKLFGFVLRRIRYADMQEVSGGFGFGLTEHWTNLWPWKFVTIRRKTGLFKNFVINPREREIFIADLRRRILEFGTSKTSS